jgi:hypothetical protein
MHLRLCDVEASQGRIVPWLHHGAVGSAPRYTRAACLSPCLSICTTRFSHTHSHLSLKVQLGTNQRHVSPIRECTPLPRYLLCLHHLKVHVESSCARTSVNVRDFSDGSLLPNDVARLISGSTAENCLVVTNSCKVVVTGVIIPLHVSFALYSHPDFTVLRTDFFGWEMKEH